MIIMIALLFSFRPIVSSILFFMPETTFYNIEAAFIAILLLFYFVYYIDKFAFRKGHKKIEFILFLALLLPFYLALTAYISFGQPLMYGILSKREYFLSISGLLIFYLFKTGKISIQGIKNVFLVVCWATFVYYILLVVIVGPQTIFDGGSGVVVFSETKGGFVYKFNVEFIAFGIIYYFILFIDKLKIKHLLFVLILSSYILFFLKGRGLILVLLITLILIAVINTNLKQKLLYAILLILPTILVINIVLLFYEESFSSFLDMFSNILLVLQGEYSGESSADLRIIQVNFALKLLNDDFLRWIFGIGNLSYQWQGGFTQFGYFYPTDIGAFGAICVFGTLIFSVSKFIYYFFYKYYKSASKYLNKDRLFVKSVIFYVIYYSIQSIQTGADLFHFQIVVILLFIVYCFYIHFKPDQEDHYRNQFAKLEK